MVAFAGAGPCPQITSVLSLRTSLTMIGTSPPGPLRCGSTTCSGKAVATAASKAFPPFSKVALPTAVAIQCVDATTPNVPSISGRVVNGFGLMFFMGDLCRTSGHINHSCGPRPTRHRSCCLTRSRSDDSNRRPMFIRLLGDDYEAREHALQSELLGWQFPASLAFVRQIRFCLR